MSFFAELKRRNHIAGQLNEMAKSAQVPDYAMGLAYDSLGDKEHAIEALEHALREVTKATCSCCPEIPCSTIFAAIRASKL